MCLPTNKLFCGAICLIGLLITGCPPSQTGENPSVDTPPPEIHVEHAHKTPETVIEATEALEHLAEDIGSAFDKGDADAAHGPLHDIGATLEAAGLLVSKSELPDDKKLAASEALKELTECYGKVDAKMHGAEDGVDYSDVSEKIDGALKAFCSAVGHEGAHGEHADHDDEEGEHKEGEHADEEGEHAEGEHKEGEHAEEEGEHSEGEESEAESTEGEQPESENAEESEASSQE